jgi:hypothetical protein
MFPPTVVVDICKYIAGLLAEYGTLLNSVTSRILRFARQAMKSEKRIVVAAKVAGWIGPRNSVIEHSAYGHTIYRSLMNAETNDHATVLIHDDQNPIGLERYGFAVKQINAPITVFAVTE